MRISSLFLLSVLLCSAAAVPQFLQRFLHHHDDSAIVPVNNAEHEREASLGAAAALTPEKSEEQPTPITAPFTQMTARCHGGSHWHCHYRGKLICGCFSHKPPKNAPLHSDNNNNNNDEEEEEARLTGGSEVDMFRHYNVTEGSFLGHVDPGNPGTLVPLFTILCSFDTFYYCYYVPGGWYHGIYIPGRWVCGCGPPLPTIDPRPEEAARPPRRPCQEKAGAPGPHADARGEVVEVIEEVAKRVNSQNATSELAFESLQLGLCKGIDVAFRCCPVCIAGVLTQQCWCRVVSFPCPKVKCC